MCVWEIKTAYLFSFFKYIQDTKAKPIIFYIFYVSSLKSVIFRWKSLQIYPLGNKYLKRIKDQSQTSPIIYYSYAQASSPILNI